MKNVAFCVLLVLATGVFSVGQTYKVLWSFGAPNDGANPVSNLIFDGAGNMYGTTRLGGAFDGGTVFELSPNSDGTWSETVLYNFCALQCLDGAEPEAGLISDSAGNLYGTTYGGGNSAFCSVGNDCGVVFELSPPLSQGGVWTETVLYNFCSTGSQNDCTDGSHPVSQLAMDTVGNLYGTTSTGGTGHYPGLGGGGTVFELSPTPTRWILTPLYNFCSQGEGKFCPDGSSPLASVTFDGSGNLYGTTEFGGGGIGEVFELSPTASGWTESTVYTSHFAQLGFQLEGAVSISNGTLYTTFFSGGNNGDNAGGILRLNPDQHRFKSLPLNFQNGANPAAGVLINSANNALFGTTSYGGTNRGGTIFEINSPSYTVLYNFCSQPNCTDGEDPFGSLVEDKMGNLYGTTKFGGANNQGVVFEITP